MKDAKNDRELAVIESIYEALDAGDPRTALRLAREDPDARTGDDPVLRFLAGVALSDLDRSGEAAEELAAAVALDPDDAEFRAGLALALFRCCRFDEARVHAERAVQLDAAHADGHVVLGLLLERVGDLDRAEEQLTIAADLDGERFPEPQRLTWDEFDRRIVAAREQLPPPFREHLERVGLIVEELPPDELLFEESPPLDPELLGLFCGVPLDAGTHLSAGGELPPRIYLFKRNLERFVPQRADLDREIAVTLYHELGHYLGLDEEELEELDFG